MYRMTATIFQKYCLNLVLLISLFLFTGCAKKTTVILLPDPDGKVGHITIYNEAGAVDVTQARESTMISDRDSSPSTPEKLSASDIDADFALVLSVLPEKPEHFILYFRSELTELTADSTRTLPKILKSIENRNSQNISIFGHTDTAGDNPYNFDLSRERALAISQLLIKKGVKPDHIQATPHGEENPFIKTADDVHEPINRRVEVVVR